MKRILLSLVFTGLLSLTASSAFACPGSEHEAKAACGCGSSCEKACGEHKADMATGCPAHDKAAIVTAPRGACVGDVSCCCWGGECLGDSACCKKLSCVSKKKEAKVVANPAAPAPK